MNIRTMTADEVLKQRSMDFIHREFVVDAPDEDNDLRRKIYAICMKRWETDYTAFQVLRFYIIRDNQPLLLTTHLCRVLDWEYDEENEGMLVEGGGMDMALHVVSCLSQQLFDDSYSIRSEWLAR